MKLKLMRLDAEIPMSESWVSVLEVHDCTLFARIVESFVSEKGKYADEPYLLFSESGKVVSPRKAFVILNSLPILPLNDRTLLAGLYHAVEDQLERSSKQYEEAQQHFANLQDELEDVACGLWGEYGFSTNWDVATLLKAFCFVPLVGDGCSFLDNCKRFLGLCADISINKPIFMVNVKSFLAEKELKELYDHAFFLGSELLLLESWKDERMFERERKTVIDLHFLVE